MVENFKIKVNLYVMINKIDFEVVWEEDLITVNIMVSDFS